MINQTHDMDAVAKILNHPRVYRMISDDMSPSPFIPMDYVGAIYLMDESRVGVVRIDPMNGICCICHIATLPELWGGAKGFGMEFIEWLFNNTVYIKVVGIIPAYNRLVIKLCRDCGFSQEGVIRKSFMKKWKIYDQMIFGLSKSEYCKGGTSCHQQ